MVSAKSLGAAPVRADRRPWVWAMGLAGLMVLLELSSVPLPATVPALGSDRGTAPLTVDPLASATASLQSGAGPALGHAGTCTLRGSAVSCTERAPALRPGAPGSLVWLQLTKSISSAPPARYVGVMAYDPGDHEVILFGGFDGTWVRGDTWAYANQQWRDLTGLLNNAPPARYVASMTYDAKDGYLLLFGGYNATTSPNPVVFFNDTWKFDHGAWNPLTPTRSPPARWRESMAYDAADGYVVMFGGTTDAAAPSPNVLNDTWKFVGGNWTDLSKNVTGSPPGRYRATMVYDPTDAYCVLFGGSTVSSTSGGVDNATWTYHNLVWKPLKPNPAPSARAYYSFVWDSAAGYAVLFGGTNEATTYSHFSNDTWKFLAGSWLNLSGGLTKVPSVRYGHMAAFDGLDQYELQYGGQTASGTTVQYLADTWSYGPSVISSARVSRARFDLHQNTTFNVSAIATVSTLILNYTGLPTGCLNANTPFLNCTPTQTGGFNVTVWVNASSGGTSSSNVSLVVRADPNVTSYLASPATVTNGTTFHLLVSVANGSGSDRYRFVGLPSGCTSANTSNLSCTPRQTGLFPVEVQAVDAAGYPAFANTTVLVNPKPQVSSFVASPSTVDVHQNVTFQASASGGTGTLVYNYSGLPVECGSPTTVQFTCAPVFPGVYNVRVNVSDAFGWVDHKNVSVIVNPDPSILSSAVAPLVVDLGAPVTFWANGTGGTGTLTATYSSTPPGCTPAAGSPFTCIPSAAGTFSVRATVRDQLGVQSSSSLTLVVNPLPMIDQFVATPQTIDVGQAAHFAVTVSGGTAPFTFLYVALPASCPQSHNSSLSCTVRGPAGNYSVGVTVNDVFGHPQTTYVELVVNADPRVSSVSASPNPLEVGHRVTITVTVAGGTGPFTYRYATLPSGCATQNNSGLSCVPSSPGNFTINASVVDALGVAANGSGNLVVQAASSGTSTPSAFAGSASYLVIGGVIALVAAVAVVVLLRRRRPPAPPPEEEWNEAPVAEESAPEYAEGPPY